MDLEIYYTPHAKQTLQQTYNFINNKFGANTADKFVVKAEKTILLIAKYPYMFKSSTIDKDVRIGLISKQTSLFYRVTDKSIHLLFFCDNRMEPLISQ